MVEHQRINREKTEELEVSSHKKRAQQQLYDQLKAPDEGSVDFQAEPSLEKHTALLANARSDKQRANIVTQLQQSYGNAYVQRLLNSGTVRTRLTVSQPDDEYEREADRVANTVMQTSAYPIQCQEGEEEEELQMKAASQVQRQEEEEEEEEEIQPKASSQIQRQAEEEEELQMKVASQVQRQEEEEEEKEEIQPKASSQIQRQAEEKEELQTKAVEAQLAAASEDLETRINAARGGGQPLDDSIRASLEPQFGHDFSDVKVHADAEANRLSLQLGAEAFTTGHDIFFKEGAYQPDSSSGKGLIAHELTHVVQQEGGTTTQVRQKAIEQSRSESTNIVQRAPGDTIVGWHTNSISASSGFLKHQVGWNSSTGNLADLDHIRTREQVSWPACTWPVLEAGYAAPGQHHGMGTTAGTQGYNNDTHQASQPFFDITQLRDKTNAQYLAKGAQSAPFVMNQVYQYSTDGGATWHDIPGSQYTLTRTLRRKGWRGKRYVYTLTKQGATDGAAHLTTSIEVKT